jgi:indolepyruvate ferredoxin oxidoreductase
MGAVRVLARLRAGRGTWLDPFKNGAERRLDRALTEQYERDVDALLALLDQSTVARAVRIACWPEKIRGYGHVRARNAERAEKERAALWDELRGSLVGGGQSA